MALLLVFVLVAACVPLGSITAFAAENDETDISAVEAEIDAGSEESTVPTETDNETAPPPDESAGTEPEEEHPPQKLWRKILPLPNRRKKSLNPLRMRKKRNPIPKTRSWICPTSLTRKSWNSCGSCSRMVKSQWILTSRSFLVRTPPMAAAPALKPVTAAVEVMQRAVVPATW